MKNISIDIGSQNIRIVESKGFRKSFTINNLCMTSTPLTVYEDGMIYDIERLANHIRNSIKENNIKGSYISYIIESSTILSREIVIPTVRKNELASTIRYEMDNNLPNPVAHYILQYKLIDSYTSDNLNKYKVLVSAVPKAMVEAYLELSKMLNLEPFLLNVKHDSVIDLFKKQCEENRKIAFLLLDLGHHYIDAIIYDQCNYNYKRRISLGGKYINEAIASYYNLSISEAEKMKIETSQINFQHNNENIIEKITYKNVDQWIHEINQLIQYYTRTNEGQCIQKIWIYGGSSKITNISKYIEENIGISTSTIKDVISTNLIKINTKKINVEENDLLTDYFNALSGCVRNRVIPW